MTNQQRIDALHQNRSLPFEEWTELINTYTPEDRAYAARLAEEITLERFGTTVYFRGIIEFSNVCKNDCYYCGIRKSNCQVARYRLTEEEILECCAEGYRLGYRTFVLQGGEDGWFTDERMVQIIRAIKAQHPDCAVTLSLGERSRESYQRLFDAGADRYLLRHESADENHYGLLHPPELTLSRRMECLKDLREIGYQTGCGMMVGSPYQTAEHLARDMVFLGQFRPAMVGIGPFIPHKDTPFREFSAGSQELTLFLMSLTRIMLPNVLLPATTALGTVADNGRQLGVLAGCNVVMPNLSPMSVRKKYLLYDNKVGTDSDAEAGVRILRKQMEEIGRNVVVGRGDFRPESLPQN
ncbi:MAG: [Clostridium sp.]|nr:[FeFe] hydrogenase H-cluster radical SAM maturase HydE [Clostridium sp.]